MMMMMMMMTRGRLACVLQSQCFDGMLFNNLLTVWKFDCGLTDRTDTCMLDFFVSFVCFHLLTVLIMLSTLHRVQKITLIVRTMLACSKMCTQYVDGIYSNSVTWKIGLGNVQSH